jgi:hypothetical protein
LSLIISTGFWPSFLHLKLFFIHIFSQIRHLGIDHLSEYSKEMFHCKWDIAEKMILRIYSRELTNGKKKARIELQQNPRINIE